MHRFATLVGIVLVSLWAGCSGSNTQFSSAPLGKTGSQSDLQTGMQTNGDGKMEEDKVSSAPDTGASAAAGEAGAQANVAAADPDASLQVILPAPELRLGGRTAQAKALLNGVEESQVRWTVSTEASGVSAGTVSAQGLYESPATGSTSYKVRIHAAWLEDESVQASAELTLLPGDQVFVSCAQKSTSFPIIADVYRLPVDTKKLPNFDQIASSKSTVVCMERYDVATRAWTAGFPGVVDLFEWFALRTRTSLQVPVDGSYKFRLNSDDGSKLYIDGKLVIDNDGQHSPRSVDATVSLTAGAHELVLEYFQGPRTQIALELFWIPAKSPSGTGYVYVPKENFR